MADKEKTELTVVPMYVAPSRMTQLMGIASAANGHGAYDLVPASIPDYETRSALESVDESISSDSTEAVIAQIDELMEALELNRNALIESRNEQLTQRNALVIELRAIYAKMREVIPQSVASFSALQEARAELSIVQAQLDSLCAMREKVLTEAADQSAGLTASEIQDAHDLASEMVRKEGPVRVEITEKKEWLDLCQTDFDIIAGRVKDIFDDEERVFTAIRLLEHAVQIDSAAKKDTQKRIGKAAVLVSRKGTRDWLGRKSKRIIGTSARAITNNAGPTVSVKNSETSEGI